jgi:hypothetical protein
LSWLEVDFDGVLQGGRERIEVVLVQSGHLSWFILVNKVPLSIQ